MNGHWADRPYLAGTEFTLADLMSEFILLRMPAFGGRAINDLPNGSTLRSWSATALTGASRFAQVCRSPLGLRTRGLLRRLASNRDAPVRTYEGSLSR